MKWPGLALLLGLVVAASGCHRGARASTLAPAIPRTLESVARATQRDFDCARIDQVLYVTPSVVQVRACGVRREYVLGARRRPPLPITPVTARASVELACSAASLVLESPAPAVRVVTGCDRRARYDLVCAHGLCEWTMTAHAGRWAGLAVEVPAPFQAAWVLPEGVGPVGTSESTSSADVDLESVALPPPPGAPPPTTDDAIIPAPP